jgi:predicted nucleic acid-binding protein
VNFLEFGKTGKTWPMWNNLSGASEKAEILIMELGDAIIAATALEYNEVILTANKKHYGFISNIQISRFKP